jgi:hypothetical protein
LAYTTLQTELGVSRSTLRRDLVELELLGEIVRRRGLVLHAGYFQGRAIIRAPAASEIVVVPVLRDDKRCWANLNTI